MENFTIYKDTKITVWERESFFVSAKSLEQAIQLVREDKVERDDIEQLFDTSIDLSPDENGYQPTVEILHKTKDGNVNVYDNSPKEGDESIFLLCGKVYCDAFDENGNQGVIQLMKEVGFDGALIQWEKTDDPLKLLQLTNGFESWVQLHKEEFDELNNTIV